MLLKGYLTVKQVAKELGLSEYRVRELIKRKIDPGYKDWSVAR